MFTNILRRLTALTTSVVLCTLIGSTPVMAADEVCDQNGDGVIDAFDLVLSKREMVHELHPITLDVSETECFPGDTVSVDIRLENAVPLQTLGFVLNYPSPLQPVLDESENLDYTIGDIASASALQLNAFPAVNTILCISSGNFHAEKDGIIATMSFTVPKDTPPGNYSLTFSSATFRTEWNERITSYIFERGVITVREPKTSRSGNARLETPDFGIDVSHWQGDIDWARVKQSGVKFAIIRMGYGKYAKQIDPAFETNYADATAVGMPVGVYWYSYAMSPEEAEMEAHACLEVLKGRSLDFPIAFDIEEAKQWKLPKEEFSAIVSTFCKTIEEAGYYSMVYSSASPLNKLLTDDARMRYDVWVANYHVSAPKYNYAYGIWQYSGEGTVEGINGPVDLNYLYRDYPSLIHSMLMRSKIAD